MTKWVPTSVVRVAGPVSGRNQRSKHTKGSERKSPNNKLENTDRNICPYVEAANLSSKHGWGLWGHTEAQMMPS